MNSLRPSSKVLVDLMGLLTALEYYNIDIHQCSQFAKVRILSHVTSIKTG